MGWTMAGLANDATEDFVVGGLGRLLPTEHELPREARARLDATRLGCLAASLQGLDQNDQDPLPITDIAALQKAVAKADWPAIKDSLPALHLKLLDSLACMDRAVILGYELGRSLRDTVTMPAQTAVTVPRGDGESAISPQHPWVTALTTALDQDRVANLQEWLATLAPHFPADSGAVVKTSIGRWSDFAAAAWVDSIPGKVKGSSTKPEFAKETAIGLLKQGDVWLNLLVGTESLNGILTPEAYVAAGEQALRRSARIIARVVRHYWIAIVLIVLAAAGLTALSAAYMGGAGRVWTQIAVIAGALGITAKGIATRVARLADAGEKPIYRSEELDAMAWAVTTLPDAKLTPLAVWHLRSSGIQGRASLGRA
jgi:hypothetical protein